MALKVELTDKATLESVSVCTRRTTEDLKQSLESHHTLPMLERKSHILVTVRSPKKMYFNIKNREVGKYPCL